MEQFFQLSGILRYEPVRPDLRKTFKAKTLIVDLPFDDLSNYYRALIKKKYGVHLHPPMWGNHVTVVRGDEKPRHKHLWKKYEGKAIKFDVSPHVYKVWNFWTLPVKSDALYDIRAELGLTAFHDLHVTIGREVDPKVPAWSPKQLAYLHQRKAPVEKLPTLMPRAPQVVKTVTLHSLPDYPMTQDRAERKAAKVFAQLHAELRRIKFINV